MTEIADAQDVIDRMKAARPTCADDEMHPFGIPITQEIRPETGWELDANTAAYRKRCEACANGRMFPWADQLDPERVRVFMETDPRCEHVWPLAILEETLPPKPRGGFEFL